MDSRCAVEENVEVLTVTEGGSSRRCLDSDRGRVKPAMS